MLAQACGLCPVSCVLCPGFVTTGIAWICGCRHSHCVAMLKVFCCLVSAFFSSIVWLNATHGFAKDRPTLRENESATFLQAIRLRLNSAFDLMRSKYYSLNVHAAATHRIIPQCGSMRVHSHGCSRASAMRVHSMKARSFCSGPHAKHGVSGWTASLAAIAKDCFYQSTSTTASTSTKCIRVSFVTAFPSTACPVQLANDNEEGATHLVMSGRMTQPLTLTEHCVQRPASGYGCQARNPRRGPWSFDLRRLCRNSRMYSYQHDRLLVPTELYKMYGWRSVDLSVLSLAHCQDMLGDSMALPTVGLALASLILIAGEAIPDLWE